MNPHWYRNFFEGVAVDMWRQAIPSEQTQTEVEFAWQELGLMPGCRVLDVPCGHGRHTLELGRRGCDVTGIDLSAGALALARRAADESGLRIDLVESDMRHLRQEQPCDAMLTLGNSFGYLGHEGTVEFTRAAASALRRGGRWLIDSGMAAESIIPNLKSELSFQVGDIAMKLRNNYLAAESCLETTFDFTTPVVARDSVAGSRHGVAGYSTETRQIWHWVFTVGEIRRMLAAAGFTTLATYSTTTREPYVLGSHELYLVCEKR